MAGRVLGGRYRLDSIIGRGGMADVWRGEDVRLGRPVAVKVLDRYGSTDPVIAERFQREAHTVARLSHPNIVGVYDFGAEDGVPYLVMELVEGDSLADRLTEGPLPVSDVVSIGRQMCGALAAAHDAGVVHRDVKPGNILLTPAGTVKVCDFGIAHLQHTTQPGLTATDLVMGTSDYMAPEQATGDPLDARTDLYALGCVLYAMLTGAPPFVGKTPVSILSQHVYEAPAPVASRRPDVPPGLGALVDQLLAKARADRPDDAGQVAARLEALASASARTKAAIRPLSTRAAAASPTTALPVARTSEEQVPRSHRRMVRPGSGRLAAATAVAVVLLGVAGLLGSQLAGSEGTPPAVAPPSLTVPGYTGTPPGAAPSTTAPTVAPPTASEAERPADPVAAVAAAIDAQLTAGQVERGAARDLARRLEGVVRELDRGRPEKAAEKAAELRENLDELFENGRVTSAGHAAVAGPVDALVASLTVP